MARVIAFYVPLRMRDRLSQWVRPRGGARILNFVPGPRGRYMWLPNGALWPMQTHRTAETHRRAAGDR
jgi:hypothetical protein